VEPKKGLLMNNADLAAALAAAHHMSQKDAKPFVDNIIQNIGDALIRGEEVSLTGFGKFKIKDQPARQGRNPATGETIQIAASKKAVFSSAKPLRDSLNS
jgi:DNA-binding protein HU-beta